MLKIPEDINELVNPSLYLQMVRRRWLQASIEQTELKKEAQIKTLKKTFTLKSW